MTRKDGSLALLVVVVWGLNFVVIKLGLHNMPPLMLAACALCWSPSRRCAVCRPAGHSAALAVGHGLTISFGQFAFCSALSAWYAGGAGVAGAAGASLFYHHSWRLRLWRTLTGQEAGGGSRWRSSACWCWWRGASAGACPTGGLYADPGGGVLSWACGNIFNKKIMSQATRPPIISLVVWSALIPVLPFMFASWLDRWPAAHAGESTPDRYADGSLAFTWRLSPPSSAMVSGACAASVKPGGWRRRRCWCR